MSVVHAGANPRPDLGLVFQEYIFNRGNMIGSQVLPPASVSKQHDKYPKLDREAFLRQYDTKRASNGAFNRIGWTSSEDTYSCEARGIEVKVPQAKLKDLGQAYDVERAAIDLATMALAIDYEIDVAATVFNTTTWTGSSLFTNNSSAPWATVGTDIIGQVLAAKEKVRQNTGMDADTLIISAATAVSLLKNTGIKNQFPGAPLVTLKMVMDALPMIFGLDRLLIGKGVKNTADEGQAASIGDIWSASYAMVARIPEASADWMNPGIGRTFVWNEMGSEVPTVETYYEPQTKAYVYQAEHYTDEKIQGAEFGHLIQIA